VKRSWRADARLPAYVAAAVVGVVLSIAVGRAELAAIAAPWAVLALLGVADRRPPELRAVVAVATERVLEGDEVDGDARLAWHGTGDVDVILAPLPGMEVVAPTRVVGWCVTGATHPADAPVVLPFALRARVWGRHQLGELHVRFRRPWGLLVWDEVVAVGPEVRVLPGGAKVDRLLDPHEPRDVSGAHRSSHRGQGTEFAELRPYAPGDRLRDLSWSASARLGEPWVVVHHPERTGTLLLLLDTFLDGSETGTEALARAARAAWAVASAHLRAGDRVGLLASGRVTAWLAPTAGRRARYQLLDELLSVGAVAEDRRRHQGGSRRRSVPPDALVVGVTALRSPSFAGDLLAHRRAGRTVVVIVIDTADLLPGPGDAVEGAVQRLWGAELDVARHRLSRLGVPSALVGPGGEVAAAVAGLRRAGRAPSRVQR